MAASLKISELNALSAIADEDLFLISDTSSTASKKATFSTLKTSIVGGAHTVLGVAEGTGHLGTFSGTTISDSQTVKQALQSLETATELRATAASPAFTGNLATLIGSADHPVVHRIQGGFPDVILRTNGGDVDLNQNEGRLLWEDAGGGAVGAIKMTMLPAAPMRFFTKNITAAEEKMRITTDGRVGIGKTVPLAKLHVNGSVIVEADFPDFDLRSGGERRIIFQDAGGGAEAAIKSNGANMDIFIGGVAASNRVADFDTTGLTLDSGKALNLDSVALTTVQTSGESFADNDTSLMTSAAIDDRINASSGSAVVTGVTAGTVSASKAVIVDANKDITGFRNLSITGNLSVQGTTTQVNTVTMEAQNAIVFEGATADASETTLTIIDPDADRTVKLPNQSGCLPVLAADSATAITATPEELNILDGVTATAAELNILDGVTATAAELNILDGVTSTAAELNILDGVTSTAAELNILDGVTATTAELNYVDGVTSNIQTQLDAKLASGSFTQAALHIDDIHSALGIASEATNFGTFTGSTISDNGTLKAGLQELETATEARLPKAGGILTGNFGITKSFADFNLNGNDERRIIFGDSGGSAEAGIKFKSSVMEFTGGGIANGKIQMKIADGSVDVINSLKIGGTAITSTAAELNILDGVTATAAELNILDGVTATAAELNILDGVTSTAAELNILDGVTSTAAELNILDGVTASTAELNILDGVTATAAELNALDGITSTVAELNILDGVTSTAAELNLLDGVTATTAEINYLDGVTSNIQTQINGTVSANNTNLTGTTTVAAIDLSGDIDVDGTANLDAVDIDGATQIDATVTVGVDDTGYDVKFFGATSGAYMLWDESEDDLVLAGAAGLDIAGNIDVDGTTNLDAVDIDGDVDLAGDLTFSAAKDIQIIDNNANALEIAEAGNNYMVFDSTDNSEQVEFGVNVSLDSERLYFTHNAPLIRLPDNKAAALTIENHDGTAAEFVVFTTSNSGLALTTKQAHQHNSTFTVGEDDTGYDVKFFGATASAYMLWDESADDLILAGAAGLVVPDGQFTLGSTAVTSTAAELNILDGVTSTAAELNILDGVTSTTAELNILDGVTSTAAELNILDGVTATAAELNLVAGITAGTASASKALILDSNKDFTGVRNITITGDLSVAGSMTTVDTVTMTAQNAIVFEGATADDHESTLTIIDPTADRTIKLPNQSGCLPVLAADSATQISATPEEINVLDGITSTVAELNILDGVTSTAAELNLLDGITAGTVSASLAVIVDSNKDVTGFRNVTLTGELDAATLDISGDADIDGTANLDAVDIDGDVDLAGDLTFSAVKDIKIVDNDAAALEIKEGNNAYMTFGTTNGAELIQISKLLKIDANIGVTNQATDFLMKDNTAAALDITESSNSYLKFDTTNSSELITAGVAVNFAAGLQIGTVAVTASAAELNILDGVTSTAAELNILDGVTSTAAELNILDGVTSTTAELNILDGVTSTAAELNLLDGSTDATWTATLEGSTGNPGSKVTATGQYVRMGKLIMASVHFNNVDTTSYAGDISISGLPVTSKDTATAMFMGNVYNSGMISGATDSVQALVADNGTTISFLENANNSALQWGTVGAGKHMRVQVVYIAA